MKRWLQSIPWASWAWIAGLIFAGFVLATAAIAAPSWLMALPARAVLILLGAVVICLGLWCVVEELR